MSSTLPPPPAASVGTAETHRPPSRFGKVAAVVGIVLGFLLFVVPGLFAWRSYRRWERGEIRNPTFAWAMVPVFLVAATGMGIYVALYRTPLLVDDFSDRSNDWYTAGPPNTARFVDGGFELVVGSGQAGDISLSGLRWREGSRPNVAVEADVELLTGDDAFAGVGCFDADGDIGYLFVVTSGGEWQIRLVRGGQGPPLAEGNTDADLQDGLRIRGECRGGYGDHEVRMFVDETLVSTLAVPPRIFGFSGVAIAIVATSSDGVQARFDDVLAIGIEPSAD